jgi:hypothetical protein
VAIFWTIWTAPAIPEQVLEADTKLESDWWLCYVFDMEREQPIALLQKNRGACVDSQSDAL